MANLGDPLGCDIACSAGFPLVMRLCWGQENLQNAALRRLNADEGCLESIGDDPDYGFNLASQLNKSFDASQPGAKAAVGSRVCAELGKDPRLNRVTARILTGQVSEGDGTGLLAFISGESTNGPFELVAAVGDMTVDRMNQGVESTLTGGTR